MQGSIKVLPLRDKIYDRIRDHIVYGQLPPDSQVGIATLARELGVSQTPTREALSQLEKDGHLVMHPNRGFFTKPLTVEEAEQIYPLVWTLEQLAVSSQPDFGEKAINRLNQLNGKLLEAAGNPRKALLADRAFHEALVAGCHNEMLLSFLSTLREMANRYEYAFMKETELIPHSIEQHRKLIDFLEKGRRDKLQHMLERHWQSSLTFVDGWLNDR